MEETTNANLLADFIAKQQQPREQIEAPPYIEDEPIELDEPIDVSTESGEDYQSEAIVAIQLIDSGFGILGMTISGLPAERYQKFTKSSPPRHYVDATAKLIEKYSLKGALSPEMVFLIALVSVYSPSVSQAFADRVMVAKKAREEAERREREAVREEIKAAREAKKSADEAAKKD
jgi:hypothetical protein